MRNIHLVAADTDQRHEQERALLAQKFDVTASTVPCGWENPTLLVLDEEHLGREATDQVLSELAGGGPPTLVKIDARKNHGGNLDKHDFRFRVAQLSDVPRVAWMYGPQDTESFVTRVRAAVLQSEPPHIHVIEDDAELRDDLLRDLASANFSATFSETLRDARAMFEIGPIDLLIVDRKLPDGDGLDFIRELRRRNILTPAIVLTIWREAKAVIEGLDAGADEYIAKPITDVDVFLARIRVALRGKDRDSVLRFGSLEIDRASQVTRWSGTRIDLIKRDQEVLTYLAERVGLDIPLPMIMEDIWGVHVSERTDRSTSERNGPLIARRRSIKQAFAAAGLSDPIVNEKSTYRFDPRPFLKLKK